MHFLSHHVTVEDFAFLKEVSFAAVYLAIKKGDIEVVFVGKYDLMMIDFSLYADYQFKKRQRRADAKRPAIGKWRIIKKQ